MEYNLETRSKERFKSCWKIKKLVLDVETEWRPTLFHELYVCTNWTSFILLWFWEQEKRCIVPLYESIWMEEIERTGSITRWKELKSSATFCSHKSLDAETFCSCRFLLRVGLDAATSSCEYKPWFASTQRGKNCAEKGLISDVEWNIHHRPQTTDICTSQDALESMKPRTSSSAALLRVDTEDCKLGNCSLAKPTAGASMSQWANTVSGFRWCHNNYEHTVGV